MALMKEFVDSLPTKPLLDREKIEVAAIKFAQIAPEAIRIIIPKPASRKTYRGIV